MTAMDKIKYLESDEIHYQGHPDVVFSCVCEDNKFLLHAFKVMREIAHTIMGNLTEGDNLEFSDVDKEFESRMKDSAPK